MKLLLLGLALVMSGCATYSVEPFYDAGSGKVICCRATATNSKNIQTVNFFAAETDGNFIVRFAETGVSASAPIASAAIAASDVAGAVTASAIAASKFAP